MVRALVDHRQMETASFCRVECVSVIDIFESWNSFFFHRKFVWIRLIDFGQNSGRWTCQLINLQWWRLRILSSSSLLATRHPKSKRSENSTWGMNINVKQMDNLMLFLECITTKFSMCYTEVKLGQCLPNRLKANYWSPGMDKILTLPNTESLLMSCRLALSKSYDSLPFLNLTQTTGPLWL